MALLGWLFIGHLFAPLLPAADHSYIAGLILLAAAPCTAMVFVWSDLYRGRAAFHAEPGGAQRRHHGVRLRAAGRPAARPLLDHGAVGDPADLGRALYRGARHHCAGLARALLASGQAALDATLAQLQPVSLVALLTTLVLLFGFQGEQILAQPLMIALLAVPILIQVYLQFRAGLLAEPGALARRTAWPARRR